MPNRRADKVRIIVVDDHPMFRDAVTRVIESEPGMAVVAIGATALEAVQLAALHEPSLMLLDINMLGGGLAAARTIRTSRPGIKPVILSMSEDLDHVTAALTHGAVGYVLKGISGGDLVRAIRVALEVPADFEPAQARALLAAETRWQTERRRSRPNGSRPLTEMETSWLTLAEAGVTSADASVRLGLPAHVASAIVTAIRVNQCAGTAPESPNTARQSAPQRDRSRH
ncbi:MAG: response regulator transcription factor [Hyphomicrobiaceae bacterium]